MKKEGKSEKKNIRHLSQGELEQYFEKIGKKNSG